MPKQTIEKSKPNINKKFKEKPIEKKVRVHRFTRKCKTEQKDLSSDLDSDQDKKKFAKVMFVKGEELNEEDMMDSDDIDLREVNIEDLPSSDGEEVEDELQVELRNIEQDERLQSSKKAKANSIGTLISHASKEQNHTSIRKLLVLFKELAKGEVFILPVDTKGYRQFIEFVITKMPRIILNMIGVANIKDISKEASMRDIYGKVQQKHSMLLKSYIANYLKLINTDEGISDDSMKLYLSGSLDIILISLPYSVYIKKFIIQLSKICADYSQFSVDTQILAFVSIRRILMYYEVFNLGFDSLYQICLKKFYNHYTERARHGGGGYKAHDGIKTAQNCFRELVEMNESTAYQIQFQYIRQIAMHLQSVKKNWSKDNMKKIYNWSFLLSLQMLSYSITGLLVHPLVVILQDVQQMSTSIKHFPYNLKISQMLVSLAQNHNVIIPVIVGDLLLNVFGNDIFNQKNKKDDTIDINIALKISKVQSQKTKDAIIKETFNHIVLYLAVLTKLEAFPEIVIPIRQQLVKLKKTLKQQSYAKWAGSLIKMIDSDIESLNKDRSAKGQLLIESKKITLEKAREIEHKLN